MYYLKGDVDFKELSDLGFEDLKVCFRKDTIAGGEIYISKGNRAITRLHPYSTREVPTKQEIKELIDKDLVREVK